MHGRRKDDTPPQGILERLASVRAVLPPAAARIAEVILADPAAVVGMPMSELAQRARVSEGRIFAFCQEIGGCGYPQVKIALARDLAQPAPPSDDDLTAGDGIRTIIDRIFDSNIRALQDTRRILDPERLAAAIAIISRARRVEVYGIGSSVAVAEDINYRLLRIGIEAKALVEPHIQLISASLAGPHVAVIAVSHSGSMQDTVAATRVAKAAGARTICITKYGKSPIQAHCDVVLHTIAREARFREEAMTSRIAQFAVVDALIAGVAFSNYDTAVDTVGRTLQALAVKRVGRP